MLGNRVLYALFATLFTMLFVGCAVEGPPAQGYALRSISITPANSSIAANTHRQFTALGIYENNYTEDITGLVAWGSSNPNIAMVDSHGLVMALSTAGSTNISATYGGRTGSARLTVTTATINTIVLTPVSPSIPCNVAQQFTAIGTFSDGTSQNITTSAIWTSDTQSVATISTSGLATAVGIGASIITATFGGRADSTTLTVLPPTLTRISVDPANPTILPETTRQFMATGYYDNGTSENITTTVTWSSSDLSLASISSSGLATALSTSGTTTISATLGAVSGTTVLTINQSGTISLTWDAPTEFTDGSALNPAADLQSYHLYYRTSSQIYSQERMISLPNPGTLTITEQVTFAPGSYFFVVTAVTQDGLESDYSNEIIRTIY